MIIAMRWQSTRTISRVVVVGTSLVSSQEFVEFFKVPEGSLTIRDMPFQEIERRAARHPFVQSASAYRGSGDAVVVQVQERVPVAYLLQRGKQYYIDKSGTLMPYRLLNRVLDLPMITTNRRQPLDSALIQGALAIVQALEERDNTLAKEISEIRILANGEYVLLTSSAGVPVYFGSKEDTMPKVQRLLAFWHTMSEDMQRHKFQYIDVRWSGQVVVQPIS